MGRANGERGSEEMRKGGVTAVVLQVKTPIVFRFHPVPQRSELERLARAPLAAPDSPLGGNPPLNRHDRAEQKTGCQRDYRFRGASRS